MDFREFMQSDGKIYIVIAVSALVIIGIGFCSLLLGNKIKNLDEWN